MENWSYFYFARNTTLINLLTNPTIKFTIYLVLLCIAIRGKVVISIKVNKELLKGSTVILILKLLDGQPMYGYQMIKEINHSSNGVFTFNEGTLYPILHSLEAEGVVESYWTETAGRKRKYYRLTERGRQHLEAKHKEWVVFRTAMDKVLGEAIVCH